jgi:hypothetical protein
MVLNRARLGPGKYPHHWLGGRGALLDRVPVLLSARGAGGNNVLVKHHRPPPEITPGGSQAFYPCRSLLFNVKIEASLTLKISALVISVNSVGNGTAILKLGRKSILGSGGNVKSSVNVSALPSPLQKGL